MSTTVLGRSPGYLIYGIYWEMDELKEIVQEFTREITNRLKERDLLVEVSTTQKSMDSQIRELAGSLRATQQDHENRIRTLERQRLGFLVSGCVAITGVLIKVLGKI